MIHKNLLLSTSNKNKVQEFKSFGLSFDAVQGIDLQEVAGSIQDVILYKAIHAGTGLLVEDTVLTINDEEIVDIRWRIAELAKMDNPKISWTTSLAVLDEDGFVYIYTYALPCKLVDNADQVIPEDDAFGFDPYLIPDVESKPLQQTFYELAKQGLKHNVSPRKMAIEALNNGLYFAKVKASQVPEWTGEYQHN